MQLNDKRLINISKANCEYAANKATVSNVSMKMLAIIGEGVPEGINLEVDLNLIVNFELQRHTEGPW